MGGDRVVGGPIDDHWVFGKATTHVVMACPWVYTKCVCVGAWMGCAWVGCVCVCGWCSTRVHFLNIMQQTTVSDMTLARGHVPHTLIWYVC